MLREAVDIPGIRFAINEHNQFYITLVEVYFTIADISPLLAELTGFRRCQRPEVLFPLRSPSKGYFNMTPI